MSNVGPGRVFAHLTMLTWVRTFEPIRCPVLFEAPAAHRPCGWPLFIVRLLSGGRPLDVHAGGRPRQAGVSEADRQAVTHGTRVSVTIAAKIAATTPSTARGTMPIQYAGIGSSR